MWGFQQRGAITQRFQQQSYISAKHPRVRLVIRTPHCLADLLAPRPPALLVGIYTGHILLTAPPAPPPSRPFYGQCSCTGRSCRFFSVLQGLVFNMVWQEMAIWSSSER